MKHLQETKKVVLLPPQLKNNGAFVGNTYFDTAGWGYVEIDLHVGTTDAAVGSGDAATPPLVEECDTVGGSYTAVTGAALSAVIGATDDDKSYTIGINLAKAHKRYMRVKAPTADDVTGANLCIAATLSEPRGLGPIDAATRGLEELVIV